MTIGELVCPDCGGVVGAVEATEAGPPCRCFADRSSGSMSGLSASMTGQFDPMGATGSGTATGDGQDPLAAEADAAVSTDPPQVVKVCRLCGIDVAGHRRVKDAQGYYCLPCAKEQEKQDNYGRVRCRVCGRLAKEENMAAYEGTTMCGKCHAERSTMKLQEIKRMGYKGARTREDLRQVYLVLAIMGGLLVIGLLGWAVKHLLY